MKQKKPKKYLKKPKVNIKKYNVRKALRKLASEQEPLVKEVDKKEIVRDDRSLYFNKELIRERKKWLK